MLQTSHSKELVDWQHNKFREVRHQRLSSNLMLLTLDDIIHTGPLLAKPWDVCGWQLW